MKSERVIMINKKLERKIKRYVRRVNRLLICDSDMKAKFMLDFENDVFCYVEDENISDIEKVYRKFGTAEGVVEEFLKDVGIKTIHKKLSWKRIVLVGVILFILIWAVGVVSVIIDANKSNYGDFVDAPIVMDPNEDDTIEIQGEIYE